MITTPNLDLAYDSKIVWDLFVHNKNSTLEYGWIRGRILKENSKISNDRQNAALNYLVAKGVVEKVAHGRWRYKKPVGQDTNGKIERPSAAVVASAPVTVEQAEEVMPKFRGATTDLVYSALRESAKKGKEYLTGKEIQRLLGVQDDPVACNNIAASISSLEKMGWIQTDRSDNPYRSKALVVNSKGRGDTSIKHRSAAGGDLQQALVPTVQTAPAAIATQAQQRVFTLDEVREYAGLVAKREALLHERSKIAEDLLAVEALLAKYGV